ncbi:hypothetical protein [Jiangella sp. DSM 45060]|uniref:hypothetical protein n=1 Tax=Jiangella sp. DSM 45060 TaxID=1798224 RepID=UPI00087A5C15|nr:hypothetical protein [Jiangella sp. DSM 45060]SDT70177.1 hypothetical protein SAMN04515669_6149 [Jiangella sp. DSM 45060]
MTPFRNRLAAAALAVAGLLFLLYPALRPWHDEETAAGALASMGSSAWVASHLFAMIGFVLVPFGLLALRDAVKETRAERTAAASIVVFWIGAGLTLPYYGAEDFALHAIARESADGATFDLLELADAVRNGSVAVTTFGIGLILLGVGGVLAAVAVWRSGVLARWSGVLFGAGFALFLPQFFTPAASRIGHGVLLAAGCVLLAGVLWRVGQTRSTVTLPGNSRSANLPMA